MATHTTPEDWGAAGNGVTDDTAAFVAAANHAVINGLTLWGRRGSRYRFASTAMLPAELRFSGEGCTIVATDHITMIKFQGGGWRFYDCVIEGPDQHGYNANGLGIVCRGDIETSARAAGIAPNYFEDMVVEGVEFVGLGHTALDFWFARGIRTRDLSFRRIGYAGLIGYTVEDFDGHGFDIDTLYGETSSGELNCYGVGFTSRVDSVDPVRDPPSRRCYAHHGRARNQPSWHMLDTHGGRMIGFADWEISNARRAVAITHRGTDSAHDCYVRDIRAFNDLPFEILPNGNLTPESVNANGYLKKDSALWITGVATSPSRGVTVDRFFAEGHSRPGDRDGAFFIENADAILRDITDKGSFVNGVNVNGGFTGRIERHKCIDLTSWNPNNFPAGSWANRHGNAGPRPIEVRGSNNDLRYEGEYLRATSLPPGVSDLEVVITDPSPTNRLKLIGNGIKNRADGGIYLTGSSSDENFVTGNYERRMMLAAGAGEFGAGAQGEARCTRDGDVIVVELPSIGGTSTSTGFSLGTLTANFRPRSKQSFIARGTDNGIAVATVVELGADGKIILGREVANGAWTASGTKGLAAVTLSFSV
ncbi:hypothetical protein [Sphingopyxis fribergensis]